jgi:hypothetical protein
MEIIRKWHIPWNLASAKFGKQKWLWDAFAPVMPIQALVMNLRNLLQSGAAVSPAIVKMTTPNVILHSKLFPFQFLTAYRVLEATVDVDPFHKKQVLEALEQAIQLSVNNLPTFKGRTLVAADNSGSMGATISDRSTVLLKDIANTFTALAHYLFETAIAGAFSDDFRVVNLAGHGNLLSKAVQVGNAVPSGSTNGYRVMDYLITGGKDSSPSYPWYRNHLTRTHPAQERSNPILVDRIILFTDQELWTTALPRHFFQQYEEYCNLTGLRPWVYLIDVAGYGETCFPPETPKAVMISGWSESLFKFIAMFEQGLGTQVDYIRNLAAIAPTKKNTPKEEINDDGSETEE